MLFQCSACNAMASYRYFPLCEICYSSLIRCPGELKPLPYCRSAESLYIALSQGYPILKTWKSHGSTLWNFHFRHALEKKEFQFRNADWIVPIPQHFHRTWIMKGGSSLRWAGFLSRRYGIPILESVEKKQNGDFQKQTEKDLFERIHSPNPFQLSTKRASHLKGKTIWLTDDFFTTGNTLIHAAELLKSAGVKEIHIKTLGFRPDRRPAEPPQIPSSNG